MPIRTIASIAALEARVFARSGGAAAVVVVWIWAGIAFAQETVALRRSGLSFAWSSTADALALAMALAPLLWVLRSSPQALAWQRRAAPSAAILVLGQVGGVVLAAAGAAGVAVGGCLAVERILVGTASLGEARAGFTRGVLVLLPLAAIAPAMAAVVTGAASRVATWFLLLALGTGAVGPGIPIPLDRLLAHHEPGDSWAVPLLVASLCTTAAGIVLSTTLSAPTPSTEGTSSCASASSETSTATSKH